MKDRSKNTGEDLNKILIGIKDSFEPSLLSPCLYYKWNLTEDDATDESLWKLR